MAEKRERRLRPRPLHRWRRDRRHVATAGTETSATDGQWFGGACTLAAADSGKCAHTMMGLAITPPLV